MELKQFISVKSNNQLCRYKVEPRQLTVVLSLLEILQNHEAVTIKLREDRIHVGIFPFQRSMQFSSLPLYYHTNDFNEIIIVVFKSNESLLVTCFTIAILTHLQPIFGCLLYSWKIPYQNRKIMPQKYKTFVQQNSWDTIFPIIITILDL
uniref:Uncharacterized protein n=1 Tax=Onchocerca volvulus TaxID=6282 RepID=A0A8R1TJM1_ONCVO